MKGQTLQISPTMTQLGLTLGIAIIIIFVGAEILHEQQQSFYNFCENKTGIIQMNGSFSEIDCDCWQNKDCSELPERCCTVGSGLI